MTIDLLVARLGLAEVARRIGVSPSTLRRWMREGMISYRYQDIVAGVVKRHSASLKAAAKRRTRQQEELGIQVPPESELTPEQVLPPRLPGARDIRRARSAEGIASGAVHQIASEFNRGETHWVTFGDDVANIDDSSVVEAAVSIWQSSGFENVSVKFMFMRFIPFNPLYRGELARKAGSWLEQWQSTKAASTIATITRYIEFYLDRARQWAETRVIFLEMIGVSVFNRLREVDTSAPLRRH